MNYSDFGAELPAMNESFNTLTNPRSAHIATMVVCATYR